MCIKVIIIMIITFIIIPDNMLCNYVEGEQFQSWIKSCEGPGDQHCVEASDLTSTSEISEVFTLCCGGPSLCHSFEPHSYLASQNTAAAQGGPASGGRQGWEPQADSPPLHCRPRQRPLTLHTWIMLKIWS